MDLRDYYRAVRAHWILAVVMLLLSVSAAGAITYLTTPEYTATTRLFVSTPDSETTSTAYQGSQFSQQRVLSYAEIIRGKRVAQLVIDELDLPMTAGQLASEVTTEVVPDTVLLDATVTDTSPLRAQTLANAIAAKFIELVADLETPEGAASPLVLVTVVEAADLPREPVIPDLPLNLSIGVMVGILLGLGLPVARAALDNTVKSKADVVDASGAPTIGAVMFDSAIGKGPSATAAIGQSKSAETYRQIRTNLQFVDVDDPPRALVITSALAGEGKTTTAINLAMVLAQSGQRVVLLEADLRRPRVTRYLRMVSGAGLTNVLAGTADLADVIQPFGDGKMSVIGSGPNPPNPSELLGSAHMKTLLHDLRESHDFVVIDAPPLLPVTDAAVLAVHADGAVIVARHGHTKREQLRMAAESLRTIEARLLGTILNMVPQKSYGYGYGYGYGYEYEADTPAVAVTTADRNSVKQPAPSRKQRRKAKV